MIERLIIIEIASNETLLELWKEAKIARQEHDSDSLVFRALTKWIQNIEDEIEYRE